MLEISRHFGNYNSVELTLISKITGISTIFTDVRGSWRYLDVRLDNRGYFRDEQI